MKPSLRARDRHNARHPGGEPVKGRLLKIVA
jgi:hypothetical protein